MSITSHRVRSSVADKYRAYVLSGLDKLEEEVTAAGGIESFMSRIPLEVKVVNILWDGDAVIISPTGNIDPDIGAVVICEPETEPTTDVGAIQLASWWRTIPGVLFPICSDMIDDVGSLEDLRMTWFACLYPSRYDHRVEQLVVSMLSRGQMPLNIEFESVGVTIASLIGLQHNEYLDIGQSQYAPTIAKAILEYYIIQKKTPCPALSSDQEVVILNWVLQGDSELQAAYFAAQEVTA